MEDIYQFYRLYYLFDVAYGDRLRRRGEEIEMWIQIDRIDIVYHLEVYYVLNYN